MPTCQRRKFEIVYRAVMMLSLLMIIWPVTAQDEHTTTVAAYRQAIVFSGPDVTFAERGVLNPGVPTTIIERNQLGTWLHLQRIAEDGSIVMDGWVMTWDLNLPPELQYADVPVADTADADPTNVNSQSMSQLYTAPLIPQLSTAMHEVFERGQAAGNRANSITKVGDSLSVTEQYINIFNQDDYNLGPYAALEPTLQFFRSATGEQSVAVRQGMTTYTIFDPFWASDERCEPNESPLACEYRLKQPGIAFILFGPNEVRDMTRDIFHENMRRIVETSINAGVIPVLSTFSTHEDETFFWQSVNFNLELLALAEDYQVPLMNLWAAARPLPRRGLDVDLVHLTQTGANVLQYPHGRHLEWESGVALQNLLVLHTLDEIRRSLGLGENA